MADMIAQIDTRTLIWIIIAVFGAIGGSYMFIFRHLANSKGHPNKEDIVFKDVCEPKMDCIEAKLDANKELTEERFDNVDKKLESIAELIRNHGNPKPRLRT